MIDDEAGNDGGVKILILLFSGANGGMNIQIPTDHIKVVTLALFAGVTAGVCV